MAHSRRAFLTATTGIAAASTGCLSRLNPWGGGGDGTNDESEETDEETETEQSDESSEGENVDENEDGSEKDESAAEDENDSGENESGGGKTDDQQPEAEDDSTRPNASETELDDGDLESESEAIIHDNNVEIRGVIENNTGQAIDQVTIDVVLVDEQNNEMFRQRDGTLGLAEWSTWEFSVTAEGQEYVENVDGYDIYVTAESH